VFVEPHTDAAGFARDLGEAIAKWQDALPGLDMISENADAYELTMPPTLDGGHETHFPRVLDEFLKIVDEQRWPAALVERTLNKYALLAEAAAKTGELR
jgi:hypothetical protein